MSSQSFAAACAAQRNRTADGRRQLSGRIQTNSAYCLVCKGKHIPPEVEFIDLAATIESITKEEKVPSKTEKGTCENCGKKAEIRVHLGKYCCSRCINLRSTINSNPDLAISALREMQPQVLEGLGNQAAIEDATVLANIVDALGIDGCNPLEYVVALDIAHELERNHAAVMVVQRGNDHLVVENLHRYLGAVDAAGLVEHVQALDHAYEIERDRAAWLERLSDWIEVPEGVGLIEYVQGLDMAYDASLAELLEIETLLRANGNGDLPWRQFIEGLVVANDFEIERVYTMEQELATAKRSLEVYAEQPKAHEEHAAAIAELRTYLGMADDQPVGDIIDAVALLSQTIAQYNRNNDDLHTANQLLQELGEERAATIERMADTIGTLRTQQGAVCELQHQTATAATISLSTFDLLHDLSWLLAGMVISGAEYGPGKEHLEALNLVLDHVAVLSEVA